MGILTDRDLYRRGVNEQAQVKMAMTQEPVTVSLVTPVERAALLMVHHRISGLPVLKDGSLVGIITATDLLKAVAEMTAVAADDCIRVNLLDKGSLLKRPSSSTGSAAPSSGWEGTQSQRTSGQSVFCACEALMAPSPRSSYGARDIPC